MKNGLAKTIIELKENNMLDATETNRLKSMFNSKDVDVVISCICNELEKIKKYIDDGYDISICNDHVLRYTVSHGFVELSCLLLRNGIEP